MSAFDPKRTLTGRLTVSRLASVGLLLGEQKCKLGSQLPVCCTVWMNDVVIGGYVCTHWLVADFEYSAKAAANRHDPLLTRCRQPVRGDERRRGQIPAVRHILVDERLREESVHRRQQRIAPD